MNAPSMAPRGAAATWYNGAAAASAGIARDVDESGGGRRAAKMRAGQTWPSRENR
jgi:hypothetical protein